MAYRMDYYDLPESWRVNGPTIYGFRYGYGPPPYPPPEVWYDMPNGIGVAYDPATGKLKVSVPDGTTLTGSWSAFYNYGPAHGTDPNRPNAVYYGTVTNPNPVCECEAVVHTSPINKTASGYDLAVSIDAGSCSGPLTGISWIPTPDSGQGTPTAIYNNLEYGKLLEGGVGAINNSTCEIALNFSSILNPGSYPSSCPL